MIAVPRGYDSKGKDLGEHAALYKLVLASRWMCT